MSTSLDFVRKVAVSDRLKAPFKNLTDAQKVTAFHCVTGFLAEVVAHGYRVTATELATEALDAAEAAAKEVGK